MKSAPHNPDFPMQRKITHEYSDPLDLVWQQCAENLGFKIERTHSAYATSDGKGTIAITHPVDFDEDDSLAQFIFHEICHALVEGPEGEQTTDWGLTSFGTNPWREHACLRLQAWLAGEYGLRDFFAPTTDFRTSFWNQLGENPLEAPEAQGGRLEKSCIASRIGLQRAFLPRYHDPLHLALSTTRKLIDALQLAIAAKSPLDNKKPSLWSLFQHPEPLHRLKHATIPSWARQYRCQDCAWFSVGQNRSFCVQVPKKRLDSDEPACSHFEPVTELDCLTCGACCREAYDRVEVKPGEAFIQLHPNWVTREKRHFKIKRVESHCIALISEREKDNPLPHYACQCYLDRPSTCRDFQKGGANCLFARRKLGLSI